MTTRSSSGVVRPHQRVGRHRAAGRRSPSAAGRPDVARRAPGRLELVPQAQDLRRPDRRSRSTAGPAAGPGRRRRRARFAVASTGTRFAPDQHSARSSPPSYRSPRTRRRARRGCRAASTAATRRTGSRRGRAAHRASASSTSCALEDAHGGSQHARILTEGGAIRATARGVIAQLTATPERPRRSSSSAIRMASSIRVSTICDSGTVLITSPLDEDLPLAVAGRDAEVGLAGLARAVDDAAHDGDPQRHLEPSRPAVTSLGERVDVDLRAPARRAGDDLELARPQVQRLEDLDADLDLLDRRRRQRHPDGVADPLGEQGAERDGGLDRALERRAGLGDAEVQRAVARARRAARRPGP